MATQNYLSLPALSFIILVILSYDLLALGSLLRSVEDHVTLTPSTALTEVSPKASHVRRTTLTSSGQGDFTCGPDRPCSNGACCGESGWCGYSPTYCGDGCQSHCDAKAECGEFAAIPGTKCPLNVCCSEFGFCGTTEDFCAGGCQSNCEQPLPSAPPSNTQQRIIGYWEAWNAQHPCGKMPIGEIPVQLLTHLNVAFGYVNHDYQVTNMDGVSTEIYRNVGQIKSRNPSLKIMISLGGWAFSDPGPWQDVFPTMVSSQANRAKFINNLLGFLSEYGYDGVDWEYPGAKDRGGSDENGVNYTALLKELRNAIGSSGRDYLITFTAPTSYWYLRHFDLKNMMDYVDWVNLMSYDLHGIWDSSNPIGSHVLAHTNLTEIDLALDLFWRVGVEPSAIVLGLGAYGRSFHLESASCWKPGCRFHGPGAAGPCTGTPGILSYREITQIRETTGATAFLDTNAAARYLIYGDGSWISFDDPGTFKQKINFANSKGLSGLMVWAIDLDDSRLSALSSIANAEALSTPETLFDLVDLKYLFPTEDLPAQDSKPSYGLINFGNLADSGEMDPGSTGFGFVLVAGDSHAVTQLRRRDGLPDPFIFLDCPHDVMERPFNETQTARVCAANQLARAVSLDTARDQSMPPEVVKRGPTSQVFDFRFDFNFDLVRKDTNNTSIRIDYSNIKGYWNAVVNSPGIQSRDLGPRLEERYFAPDHIDWRKVYTNSESFQYEPDAAIPIKEDMSAPLFWQTVEQCNLDGSDYDEGFGAYVQGRLDAEYYYGFSLIASLDSGFNVKQANGLIQVRGQTDLTYGIGGVGDIDISRAKKGNPALNEGKPISLPGHVVRTGNSNKWISINPYYSTTYQMVTLNGKDGNDYNASIAPFSGYLSTRAITNLGKFNAYFPSPHADELGSEDDNREKNKLSIGDNDVLYSTANDGGQIAVGTFIKFGLKVDLFLATKLGPFKFDLPDMSLTYHTMSAFRFYPGAKGDNTTVCTDYEVLTNVFQETKNGHIVDWEEDSDLVALAYDRQSIPDGGVCYPNKWPERRKRSEVGDGESQPMDRSWMASTNKTVYEHSTHKRQDGSEVAMIEARQGSGSISSMPGWGYLPDTAVDPNTYLGVVGDRILNDAPVKFLCRDCMDCELEVQDQRSRRCCGCVSMDLRWGYRDIPDCKSCNEDDGVWGNSVILRKGQTQGYANLTTPLVGDRSPHLGSGDAQEEDKRDSSDSEAHVLGKRVSGTATLSVKKVTVCGDQFWNAGQYRYPAFPAQETFPWDGIDNGMWDSIGRYWGNSSDSCSNWAVSDRQPADKVYRGGVQIRAKYQTEHVFEGQLIGDFFSWWLDKGHIMNQNPPVTNPRTKVPCAFTEEYIMEAHTTKNAYPWRLDGNPVPFVNLMLAELGSIKHLDRLTIYQARPNRKKGSMFTGAQPTAADKYTQMYQDEQLQLGTSSLRLRFSGILKTGNSPSSLSQGMTFSYLNNPTVFDAFCGTYEAIYDLLGDFDTWWVNNGQGLTIPSLQREWKDYIRTVLDSLVNRSRATFEFMYSNKRIQDWIESLQPIDPLPTGHSSPRPKRARYEYKHPVSDATEHYYDPALPQTPPGTNSMNVVRGQLSHNRKRDGGEMDNNSESGIATETDASEFRVPSMPPPKQLQRTPSPVKPSIKTSADLELLNKPVYRQELATENPGAVLPNDIKSLYFAIENATIHQEEIIPKEVQDQVSSLMGENAARTRFFRAAETAGGTLAAEATLARLRSIVDIAKSSTEQGRHETAWNHLVHTPMLDLAFGMAGSQVVVEPAMTATIAKNSVPRLRRRIDAACDTASLAWSVPNSSSVAQSEDSDTPQQNNSDRKKVDYVLVANISDAKLKTVIHSTVLDMGVSGHGTHFNQTEYLPLRYNPVAVTIETKVKSSIRDPLLQLGIWVAAWHERMAQVRTFRSQAVKLTAEERVQLFSTRLVSVPLIVVNSFDWEVYFACDNQSSVSMYGPMSLGSTKTLLSAYVLLTSLEAIGKWVGTTFCDSIKTWVLCDKS
ncbi:hypothetical protein O1611_g4852 [Lasiodiplodia mahajangana]|uniref:Uncharacterized protein n=1 Tax=Lasiodiplodia mahajangana TaxID=1108764 RepID=A0ACC2JMP3_9PEZI|nr:hypothetical protein O1611_g4852 [Lasiodiplodia mahajangana]